LLTVKECLFIKDDVLSRDDDTLIWNPDPINISRVIADKVVNIGL
jgi:hypothetical protein